MSYKVRENIYIIRTIDDLLNIHRIIVNLTTFSGCTFRLMNDIDVTQYCLDNIASGGMGWTPIGDLAVGGRSFRGTFDGQGYTINGLTFDSTTRPSGFFAICGVGGVIKNLNLTNVDIRNTAPYGGVVCTISNGTMITKCYTQGNIYTANSSYVGGIVGRMEINSLIEECCSLININSIGNSGGISGRMNPNANAVIRNCFSKGTIIAPLSRNTYSGIGNPNTGIVENCYSTIDINPSTATGSILNGIGKCADVNSYIRNCVALNKIISPVSNGIAGRISSENIGPGILSNNYALNTMLVKGNTVTSNDPNSLQGADITKEQSITQSFYENIGWDFNDIWKMSNPTSVYEGYPIFKWMNE